ncbi:MAG: lamin tail domain-containing protein, partial [Myxococcota bacterium]
ASDGYVAVAGDCNDGDSAINPDADEICDDADTDEDCDGVADDADDDTTEESKTTFYLDSDMDTFGDDETSETVCDASDGYVAVAGDCNDGDSAINPDADEICDDADTDEDCDGNADDADDDTTDESKTTYYADSDMDTFGDPDTSELFCDPATGFVTDNNDCDDARDDINPEGTEVCDADNADEDCDGDADDADDSVDAETYITYYIDDDGDGFGVDDSLTNLAQCDEPSGYADAAGDCNDDATDTDAADTYPGADETFGTATDEVDFDCDGSVGWDLDDVVAAMSASTDPLEDPFIITEFMPNPGIFADEDAEWFEVYNNTGEQVDLTGLEISDDDSDSDTIASSAAVIASADSYLVFARSDDTSANGLPQIDYTFSGISLGNGTDEIVLSYTDSDSTTTEFDDVAYTSSWPWDVDIAASLNALTDDNSLDTSWCEAVDSYFTDTSGDSIFGTPGAANPSCTTDSDPVE